MLRRMHGSIVFKFVYTHDHNYSKENTLGIVQIVLVACSSSMRGSIVFKFVYTHDHNYSKENTLGIVQIVLVACSSSIN